jgi:hypothetical protein
MNFDFRSRINMIMYEVTIISTLNMNLLKQMVEMEQKGGKIKIYL